MNATTRLCLSTCLLAAIAVAGCQFRAPQTHVSLQTLVAEYNANAAKAPRLWARAKIHVSYVDEKDRTIRWGSTSPFALPNGVLLLGKIDDPLSPQNFALIGYETLAMPLFKLGSSVDEDVYYFWVRLGERAKAWWGRHEFAGASEVQDIPIDPKELLSVLSICWLPKDFKLVPTVVLSMTHLPGETLAAGERCAYVLTYLDRLPINNDILLRREIHFNWDDSGVRRPFQVKLLDNNGRRVMVARLKDYRPIATTEPTENPPVMPTDIEISWPAAGSKVHLVLSEMTTADTWDKEVCRFRDAEDNALPDGFSPDDVIQVDRALETGGAAQ